MEDSRMDPEPSAPEQQTTSDLPAAVDAPAPFAGHPARPFAPMEPFVLDDLGALDEPGPAALPVLQLTPAPEFRAAREPWTAGVRLAVTGVTVMLITAELGRRAGASGRLTALCSAGACAAAVGPWLVPQLALPARRALPGLPAAGEN